MLWGSKNSKLLTIYKSINLQLNIHFLEIQQNPMSDHPQHKHFALDPIGDDGDNHRVVYHLQLSEII